MAKKKRKKSTKGMGVKFTGKLEFDGSVSEFKAVMADLQKLSADGVKIGTWPTPERPDGGLRIGTVPLPDYLDEDLLVRLTEDMPRFPIIDDICGGIRTAHLHLHGEVVLLDAARFKEVVVNVATDVAGRLAETAEYPEIVGAIGHLAPRVR